MVKFGAPKSRAIVRRPYRNQYISTKVADQIIAGTYKEEEARKFIKEEARYQGVILRRQAELKPIMQQAVIFAETRWIPPLIREERKKTRMDIRTKRILNKIRPAWGPPWHADATSWSIGETSSKAKHSQPSYTVPTAVHIQSQMRTWGMPVEPLRRVSRPRIVRRPRS